MSLTHFKWFAATIIFVLSLAAGFLSLRFITRYQRYLQVGDAAANGIFIGAAIFHLFPSAIKSFRLAGVPYSIITAFLILIASFLFLFLVDRFIYHVFLKNNVNSQSQQNSQKQHLLLSTWLLAITLSIHALTAGIALGLSGSATIISIIFFAIIAHKGFELFAFVINLHRRIGSYPQVLIIFILFSFVTPLGIGLGAMGSDLFKTGVLPALFNAFAAGTFLYIGSIHRHHNYYHQKTDSYHQYNEVLAMMAGVTVMAIVGIWV